MITIKNKCNVGITAAKMFVKYLCEVYKTVVDIEALCKKLENITEQYQFKALAMREGFNSGKRFRDCFIFITKQSLISDWEHNPALDDIWIEYFVIGSGIRSMTNKCKTRTDIMGIAFNAAKGKL